MRIGRKRITRTEQRHTQEGEQNAQIAIMVESQTLDEELQGNTRHDAGGEGKQTPIGGRIGRKARVARELEPEGGDGGAEGLAKAAQGRRPRDRAPAAVQRHV